MSSQPPETAISTVVDWLRRRQHIPLSTPERPLPIGIDVWLNTRVVLPEELGHLTFGNVLTGETNRLLDNGRQALLAIADVFRTCPVALLWARPA